MSCRPSRAEGMSVLARLEGKQWAVLHPEVKGDLSPFQATRRGRLLELRFPVRATACLGFFSSSPTSSVLCL